jgi:hypothetical protein
MTRRLLLSLPLAAPLFPADADFNGQWNIRFDNPRRRVWWLEVKGAGAGKMEGSFVGAPGGQVDEIKDLRIENGQLVFTFTRDSGKTVLKYRAKLEGGRLVGTMESPSNVIHWVGTRAPKMQADVDDGRWKRGAAVKLFNGKDTSGWNLVQEGRPGWYVKDGLMCNEKGAADAFSTAKFWNFELRAEYRYDKGSNSGIGLRGRYEVQIMDSYGRPVSGHTHGALYSRILPSVNASRPPGEWQLMEVRLVGKTVTIRLNGQLIIDRGHIAGPTAITIDPDEDQPGPIVLQGDHGLIEFKTIDVTPLTR